MDTVYELIVGNETFKGKGNLNYWDAFDQGAEILWKNPRSLVILRPIPVSRKKIIAEIREWILENGSDDLEGYVWNCLLWDGGESGASNYRMDTNEFKNLVLDTLDKIIG